MVTIQASEENWRWLRDQKGPNESFDDVLSRLRERVEQQPTVPTVDVDAIAERHELDADERAAVAATVDYLSGTFPGWAQKQEILDAVHDAHRAGKDRDWWWRTLVKQVLMAEDVVEEFGSDQGLIRLASTD